MKRSYLVSSILFLFNTFIYSQTLLPELYNKTNNSTFIEDIRETINIQERSNCNKATLKSKLDSIRVKIMDHGLWKPQLKYEFEYDAYGNNTSLFIYKIAYSPPIYFLKRLYSYNSNNQLIEEIRANWYQVPNQWEDLEKAIIEYFPNKLIVTTLIFYNNSWVNNEKHTYYKDNNSIDTLILKEVQYYGTNYWTNFSKHHINYNSNGSISNDIRYNWENNTWVNGRNNIYTYSNNNQNTSIVYYLWANNNWEFHEKEIINFDNINIALNNVSKKINNNSWLNVDSIVYQNNNINMDNQVFYNWQNNTWGKRSKRVYNYDEVSNTNYIIPNYFFSHSKFKKKLINEYWYINSNNNNWLDDGILDYYYSDINTISINELSKKAISITPNPANNYITISGITNSIINIYNISGKLVKTQNINSSNKIDISKIKKGIYIVSATKNNSIISTKKLIKL